MAPTLTPLAARVALRSSAPRRHIRAGAAQTASVEGKGGRGRPRGRCGGVWGEWGAEAREATPLPECACGSPAAAQPSSAAGRRRGPLRMCRSCWGRGRPPPRARQRRSAPSRRPACRAAALPPPEGRPGAARESARVTPAAGGSCFPPAGTRALYKQTCPGLVLALPAGVMLTGGSAKSPENAQGIGKCPQQYWRGLELLQQYLHTSIGFVNN